MKVYLATPTTLNGRGDFLKEMALKNNLYILESFYYIDKFVEDLIPYFKDFLLDSGAFTFMANSKKLNFNIEEYLQKLIKFINKNKIKYFFELDVDYLIGYDKVLELRRVLEKGTGRKCIPVFHKSRGIKEYERMCEEYNYIAIGTIGEYRGKEDVLKQLLRIANKHNTKVHGLGFTQLKHLKDFDFYSVDSTSWTCGSRFGIVYKFDGRGLSKVGVPMGMRLKTYKVLENNFKEWVKYQKYADMTF